MPGGSTGLGSAPPQMFFLRLERNPKQGVKTWHIIASVDFGSSGVGRKMAGQEGAGMLLACGSGGVDPDARCGWIKPCQIYGTQRSNHVTAINHRNQSATKCTLGTIAIASPDYKLNR